ncbi:MAG: maltokinase N-terminal cap-like domain-containing protein [Trebonia sp.]
MSILHRTTLVPSKLELLTEWLPSRLWYADPGRTPSLVKAGGFRLDDPDGEVGIEFMVAVDTSGDGPVAYHVPMTYRGAPLDGAGNALIGIAEHGVLGRRWIYDGTRDPVLVTQLAALIQGAAEPQAQSINDTPDPTVLTRPAPGSPVPGVVFVPGAAFEASDAPDGTEVRVDVAAAGTLVVSVSRVLVPAGDGDGAGEGEGGAPGTGGYVTAPWRRADDTTVRAVFATAALARHSEMRQP